MTTSNDIIKMSIISNIQQLELSLEHINPASFDSLWKTDYETLTIIRDKAIVNYNTMLEERKFAADMIYNQQITNKGA